MGKMQPNEDDERTKGEKIQDTTRDIFVFLVILLVFIIPTTYIVIRGSQPMTIPGYENTTLYEFVKNKFIYEINPDSQFMAFLYTSISPYSAFFTTLKQLYPDIDYRTKGQTPLISIENVPNAWWDNIQKECIHWLVIASS